MVQNEKQELLQGLLQIQEVLSRFSFEDRCFIIGALEERITAPPTPGTTYAEKYSGGRLLEAVVHPKQELGPLVDKTPRGEPSINGSQTGSGRHKEPATKDIIRAIRTLYHKKNRPLTMSEIKRASNYRSQNSIRNQVDKLLQQDLIKIEHGDKTGPYASILITPTAKLAQTEDEIQRTLEGEHRINPLRSKALPAQRKHTVRLALSGASEVLLNPDDTWIYRHYTGHNGRQGVFREYTPQALPDRIRVTNRILRSRAKNFLIQRTALMQKEGVKVKDIAQELGSAYVAQISTLRNKHSASYPALGFFTKFCEIAKVHPIHVLLYGPDKLGRVAKN